MVFHSTVRLLALVVLVCGGYSSHAPFLREPEKFRLLPGQNCTLSCVVDNNSLTQKYLVEWFKMGKSYHHIVLLGGNLMMNEDPNQSDYSLTIENVSETQGSYFCQLRRTTDPFNVFAISNIGVIDMLPVGATEIARANTVIHRLEMKENEQAINLTCSSALPDPQNITWKIDDEIIKTDLKSNGFILEPKEEYDNKTISCSVANSVQFPSPQVRMVYWHKPKVNFTSLDTGYCTHLKLYCQWNTDNPIVSSTMFVNGEQIDVNDANFNKGSTWMSFNLTENGRNTTESVSVTCAVENKGGSVKETIIVDACSSTPHSSTPDTSTPDTSAPSVLLIGPIFGIVAALIFLSIALLIVGACCVSYQRTGSWSLVPKKTGIQI